MRTSVKIFKRIVKKITAAGLIVVSSVSLLACGNDIDKTVKSFDIETEKTVNVWYCDELYGDYIKYVAQRVSDVNELIKINPVLVEYDSYIENIYNESIHKDNAPDVYLMSADELERASLLGVVAENNTYSKYYTQENYGKAALEAATYKGKMYGYPISFNTAFMVYNSKHAGAKESFDDITDFMNNFQVDETNEAIKQIIAWDVSDMLLNFGFAAGSIDIGGESGDDSSVITANTELLKNAMTQFQLFHDTYGIEKEEATADYCTQLFAEGSLAYAIVDVEHLKTIEAAEVEYGVCKIPSTGDGFDMQGVSDTTIAVVNQYADDLELAKAVAHILSYDYSTFLDETIGILSARIQSDDKEYNAKYQAIYDVYNSSSVKGQFMGAASVYSRYEIMLNKIWDGEDVSATVDEFVSGLSPKVDVEAGTDAETATDTENGTDAQVESNAAEG